jgi:hypothetical protein
MDLESSGAWTASVGNIPSIDSVRGLRIPSLRRPVAKWFNALRDTNPTYTIEDGICIFLSIHVGPKFVSRNARIRSPRSGLIQVRLRPRYLEHDRPVVPNRYIVTPIYRGSNKSVVAG